MNNKPHRLNYVDRTLLSGIGALTTLYLMSVTIEAIINGPATRRYWQRKAGHR